MMDCPICGGTIKAGTAPRHITRRKYHLILDDVPALVCTQCGASFFDSKIVGFMDETIHALDILDDKLKAFAQEEDAQRQPEQIA
jgi:YgiT-type zinc finger domain-containing protein